MLNQLRADPWTVVDLQDTTFSTDLVGRYAANSLDEVMAAGGRPFDVVIVGAGMFGAYLAEKIYRRGTEQNLRILVLDAGSHLFSTHVQNLPHIGLNPPDTALVTSNAEDPGRRRGVWGLPWHSNEPFTGLAYCPGGRSLFWGGWAPRLTAADLARWPQASRDELLAGYGDLEEEIGVNDTADYLSGDLNTALLAALRNVAQSSGLSIGTSIDSVDDAPLAVQASQPGSGLFSFDKYSSVPLLIEAVRDDINRRWKAGDDSQRRLFFVPRTHVVRLGFDGEKVVRIECVSEGRNRTLRAGEHLAHSFQVVLANGTIEATRLALESFPVQRGPFSMGANFMAHLRTNLTVRVRRSALNLPASTALEQGGAILRGEITNPDGSRRRYHLQILASAVKGDNPESTMWAMMPDIELFRNLLANQDPEWVTIVLRGLGEMEGDARSGPGSATSFVDLTVGGDPQQLDEFGARRAWVNVSPTPSDREAWRALAQAAVDVAAALAAPGKIEYLYGGGWTSDPPPDPFAVSHDQLGNTHHEGGTLWMGDNPSQSITNVHGRFHHVRNAYVAGPALFPTVGSANPSLTGLTLARSTAQIIVDKLRPLPSTSPKPLYTGSLQDWTMAGFGGFLQVYDILESTGGPGLLWYSREAFGDFALELEWQLASDTDNSGVFIRFPSLESAHPATDVDPAIRQGYEIQIDPRGFNPESMLANDPLRSTGAIYGIQGPSRTDVAKGPWEWNTYLIEAAGPRIRVTLNGVLVTDFTDPSPRSLRGHIGLQNHHPGSKVQFRNLRIRTLTSVREPAKKPSKQVVASH